MALETVVVNLMDFFLTINRIQIVYTSLCRLSERSMSSIPNTEQTRGSNQQQLGLVGVSLQESNHGREFMVGTEPCVAKVEYVF